MKSKVHYHQGYLNKAAYDLHAIQENIKYHCNLHVNNPKMLIRAINEYWIPWIADAAANIAKAMK